MAQYIVSLLNQLHNGFSQQDEHITMEQNIVSLLNQGHIGFSEQGGHIWTVEFQLETTTEREYYYVYYFKIISIEDHNGNPITKINTLNIGDIYFTQKYPILVFLNKNNLKKSIIKCNQPPPLNHSQIVTIKSFPNIKKNLKLPNIYYEEFMSFDTGFVLHKDKIFTIKFKLNEKPVNNNCHYTNVQFFMIILIEDYNGNGVKDDEFAVDHVYFGEKYTFHVFLNKQNALYYDFYNKRRKDYEKYTGQIIEYTEHGDIHLQYNLVNGMLSGNYMCFDSCGNIMEQSYFVDGIRHGFSTYNCYINGNNKLFTLKCKFNKGKQKELSMKYYTEGIYEIIHNYHKKNNTSIFDIFFEQHFSVKYCNFSLVWTEKFGCIISFTPSYYLYMSETKYFSEIPINILNKVY